MRQRVLFVDDEQNVLEGYKRTLRHQQDKWDMTFVTSAIEALALLEEGDFDTVVSDVTMPYKDGFQLLQEIKEDERTRDIPVVIVTGNHEIGLKRKALDLGAADLLSKPVSQDDLLARLQSVLRLKSYQDRIIGQNERLEWTIEQRTKQLEESRLEIIWRLGKAAEFRDEMTGDHVVRVGFYCRAIAEVLGVESTFVEQITLTSPLHDIGKIGIPDSILLKTGKLTPEERVIMQQHCYIGAKILGEDPAVKRPFARRNGSEPSLSLVDLEDSTLKVAARIALTHHEKWDGTGYPQGLKGEDIPLESPRIIAIADVYDALRYTRPYKRAFCESQSLEIIQNDVGKHFDPEIYSAFQRTLETIRAIQAEFPGEGIPRLEKAV